jgi:cell division protein FtsA
VDVPLGRKPASSRQVLAGIIQPRLEEIFALVARSLGRAGFEDAATAGFVVTGGTSIMEGLPELSERVLGQPVRRGAPSIIDGLVETGTSPIYATGVGLALHGAKQRPGSRQAGDGNDRGLLSRLRRRFGELF